MEQDQRMSEINNEIRLKINETQVPFTEILSTLKEMKFMIRRGTKNTEKSLRLQENQSLSDLKWLNINEVENEAATRPASRNTWYLE